MSSIDIGHFWVETFKRWRAVLHGPSALAPVTMEVCTDNTTVSLILASLRATSLTGKNMDFDIIRLTSFHL